MPTSTLPDDAVVLVTGANGFVGSRVCLRLSEAGIRTRAMVRRIGTAPDGMTHVAEHVASWDEPGALDTAMDGVTHVVHCFAIAGQDLDEAARVNVEGTRAVLAAADRAGVTRVVHVSSTSVVADDATVVDHDAALVDDAAGPYAVTKRDGEQVVREAQAAGLDTVILRPPAVLGWGATSTWGQKVPRAIATGELPWTKDPREQLGWVHVDDFAEAVLLSLSAEEAPGHTYVVANGQVTWGEYIGEVRSWFKDTPDPLVEADEAPEARRWVADRARQELGWAPRRTFTEAMREAGVHHAEV